MSRQRQYRKNNYNSYTFFKRCVDLGFATFILFFFLWLLVLVWITIKLTSKGPGIFIQSRIGKNGAIFKLYKFRTMYVETENARTDLVSSSSVTKFGRFLRHSKIDELPQIFNIFMNQISLVGPRPCLPTQLELIDERKKRNVLRSLPGITGWAQIHNIDMSDPVRLAKFDEHYVLNANIALDLNIIFRTAFGSGLGDNTKI